MITGGNRLYSAVCAWFAFFVLLVPGAVESLAFDWRQGEGFRSAVLPAVPPGKVGFTLMPPEATGIRFTNVLAGEVYYTNSIPQNGSGVTAGDVDGDGLCDLYFCGLQGGNKLYRNLGQWRFEDATEKAGVGCPGQFSTGAVLADVDGDGDLDLLVNSIGGGTRLFLNDGKGVFSERPDSGLSRKFGATSMALADIDGDGDLDLYVTNYRVTTIQDDPGTRYSVKTADGKTVVTRVNGQPVASSDYEGLFTVGPDGALIESGEPDFLYLNDGKGHFTPVSPTDEAFLDEQGKPVSLARDWGLSVMFRDFNHDGAPDIYVCNDNQSPDRIWINNGKGQFRALPSAALRQTSYSSMGVDFADVNRDGEDDFLVLDMLPRERSARLRQKIAPARSTIGENLNRLQVPRNTFFFNRGDGTFAEAAHFSGLEASDWSWTPVFLDVDLDGYEDLLVSSGFAFSIRDLDAGDVVAKLKSSGGLSPTEMRGLRRHYPSWPSANLAFRNRGDGRFEETGRRWGFNLGGISQGVCLADLDNDGDMDVVVSNLNAPAAVYRNDAGAARIAIRLLGESGNSSGIGARMIVTPENEGCPLPVQSQEMICGGRYLSGDEAMRVFAAGASTNRFSLRVVWRSGRESAVAHAEPNTIYEIAESSARPVDPRPKTEPPPLFQDASVLLRHTHHQDPFDDFARQPTLPRRLGATGPGVSWCDLTGDGWDDLVVGSGKGGAAALFLNNKQGGFTRVKPPAALARAEGELAGIVAWASAPGYTSLLVGVGNHESGSTNAPSVLRHEIWSGGFDAGAAFPGFESSSGSLALADIDGDGTLELFVAGTSIPGRFPVAASSRLFRQRDGAFHPDGKADATFRGVGLVNGAVFGDLDGDGLPELLLACEWGPIRVFRFKNGAPEEITKELGLDHFAGLWNGVVTGDFDGDGRMDIAASNWGLNTKYRPSKDRPVKCFYGDIAGRGAPAIIEATLDDVAKGWAPTRPLEVLAREMPWLKEQFPTYAAYSDATVAGLLGEKMREMAEVSANWLESTVFLNRPGGFVPVPLPMEAQLAPAFGVAAGDLDGDGLEDLFMAQNFFGTDEDSSRCDAGRGLWLKGDGKGGFAAMSAQRSGLILHGEQRGAALGDYDRDGRVDLVVGQNGAPTRLFHNTGAKPGLRVRLIGPPGNSQGIGSVLRTVFDGSKPPKMGPARELHAGSGHLSQDSLLQVLAAEGASRIWVRWPGGKTNLYAIPAGATEVELNISGKVTAKP